MVQDNTYVVRLACQSNVHIATWVNWTLVQKGVGSKAQSKLHCTTRSPDTKRSGMLKRYLRRPSVRHFRHGSQLPPKNKNFNYLLSHGLGNLAASCNAWLCALYSTSKLFDNPSAFFKPALTFSLSSSSSECFVQRDKISLWYRVDITCNCQNKINPNYEQLHRFRRLAHQTDSRQWPTKVLPNIWRLCAFLLARWQ